MKTPGITFLPIVARELRIASRRAATYRGRIGSAMVPIIIAGLWLPTFATQMSVSQGKLLFFTLSALAFAYCLLAGIRSTADCLSSEKREGTLGLLFLTDLKGYDVVLGKLASRSLGAFYGLLAIVPVLALALLLGGVTLPEVGRTALLFVNTLFFSMAAGVFVSSLSRNDRRAMFAAGVTILLVTGGPYAAVWGISLIQMKLGATVQPYMPYADLLLISPYFAFNLLRSNFLTPSMRADFYSSVLATHLLTWFLLLIASVAIPRTCQERARGRMGTRWEAFRQRWSYGKPAHRLRFRRRLLNTNAFYWLAARDRIKAWYVWFFAGALTVIWGWGGWMIQSFIFDWEISFWMLLFTFLFLKVWLTSEVCTRFVEDRASGAFELLLSSPLSIKEMARGQSMALWRQFGAPVAALFLLTYLLMQSALRSAHGGLTSGEIQFLFWSLMIIVTADLITLKWVGSWQAVVTGQVNRATLGTCVRVLFLPTIVFAVICALNALFWRIMGTTPGASSTWSFLGLLWLVISLTNDLFFGLRARWLFFHQFREAATERFSGPAPKREPIVAWFQAARERLRSRKPESDAGPSIGSSRRWKPVRVTMGVAGLLLAVFLAVLWRKHTWDQRVEQRLARLEAGGAPVSFEQLQSLRTAVPPSENAGILLQNVGNTIVAHGRVIEGADVLRKPESIKPGTVLSADDLAALAIVVKRNGAALEFLHTAAKRTRSCFPLNFQFAPPDSAAWQGLSRLSPAAAVLELETLHYLEAGDGTKAMECIQTQIGVARALGEEPYLAAAHFRFQFLQGAVRSTERLLSYELLEPTHAAALAESLRAEESRTGPVLARGFIGLRCGAIDEFRRPGRASGMMLTSGLPKLVEDLQIYIANLGGIRQRRFLELLDVYDLVIAESLKVGGQDRVNGVNATTSLAAAGQQLIGRDTELIALLRCARAGLEIERLRLETDGTIPDSSDRVAVPADPFTGERLRFQRTENGYVLYSVGRDLQDNGGINPPQSRRGGPSQPRDLIFTVEHHQRADHSETRTRKN